MEFQEITNIKGQFLFDYLGPLIYIKRRYKVPKIMSFDIIIKNPFQFYIKQSDAKNNYNTLLIVNISYASHC